jgi:hypothetical protein
MLVVLRVKKSPIFMGDFLYSLTAKYMKLIALLILPLMFYEASAQTLGGSTVYNFLNLPNTPQLSALGGINISTLTKDIGMTFNNPAMLRPSMNMQVNTAFNSIYAGIDSYSLCAGGYNSHLQTNFAVGINYFDYGDVTQTDAAGNILGAFHPADYVAQVSASRQYEKRWFYGFTLKYIHSAYGVYRSSGAAMDVGINYYDSAHLLQIGLVARNMGVQFKAYNGTTPGDLPLDVELGITKRLAHAPFQFSFTAYQLQHFNISYDDTAFNNNNGQSGSNQSSSFSADKLFRHFIFAVQAYPEDRVEITLAYNYLLRKELNIGNAGNGFTGFSFGVGVLFRKWQIRYAKSYYQNNTGYNQFGLNIQLNDQ